MPHTLPHPPPGGDDAGLFALQSRVLEAVVTGAPLPRVLDVLARGVEALSAGMLCSVLLVSEDGTTLLHGAGPSLPDEYNRTVDGAKAGPLAGSCGTAVFRREPVIVADIATDPLWGPYKDLALVHGLRACWSTPVLDGAGRVLATFAVYYREPRPPAATEVRLVTAAAHLVAIAVERQRAETSLRAGERRLRAAMEGSMDAVFFLTAVRGPDGGVTDFRFADVNDTGARLVSRRREDVIGQLLCELLPINRTGGFVDKYVRVVETRTPLEEEFQVDAPEFESKWLHHQVVPLEDGVVITTRDVTERRRLEEEHRQALKMEAVGRLAGGVAHDFNNLLTVILGNTELALARLGGAEPAAGLVEEVRAAAERAAAVTGQLLSFSRKQLLQPKVVDLNAVAEGMTRLLARVLGDCVRLVTDFAPDLPLVLADEGQVEQVMTNLATNGRDAMPGGGTLTVATAAAGKDVVLIVTDTGRGIPAEVLPHVFEPFYTTKPVGAGTGLGLATVHGIARAHGGRVEVNTVVGLGTTFRVYFPAAGNVRRPVRNRPDAGGRPQGGTERILLVEDEDGVRRMTRKVLTGFGYEVEEAACAADALAVYHAAPANSFDLLVTDVVMPGVSGRVLAEQLVALSPDLRVLFMSGHTTDAVLRSGVETAGVDFLPKPFTAAALACMVRAVLDRGRPGSATEAR